MSDRVPRSPIMTRVPSQAHSANPSATLGSLAESYLHRLYEVTCSRDEFADGVQALFDLGHEALGLPVAILARVEGETYRIEACSSPRTFGLEPGIEFELSDTYCRDVLAADRPVGFECASKSEWAEHPCYRKFALEAYYGAPVVVDGKPWGTLNFSGPDPRAEPFTPFDEQFLRLMASWVGGELSRQGVQRELERTNLLLNVLWEAQDQFLVDGATADVFDKLLSLVLDVTESEYGFIGEVLTDADETPYLKTHAITNISWNEETRAFYEENAPGGLEFRNLESLFGRVITTSDPIISNDPPHDPRGCGVPPGHPPLRAFLGLPLFDGAELVGMLGIANRGGGYDQDLCRFLAPFLSTCSGLLAAHRNELRRREAVDAVLEAEARSRVVLDTAADGIVTVDQAGCIEAINPAAEHLFGWTAMEVVGRDVGVFVPERFRAAHEEGMERYLATGEPNVVGARREVLALRKDGTEIPLELNVSEVKFGRTRLFTAILRDIRERRRVEEERERFMDELERSNRELRQFSYVASHDLQEPLRTLTTFSDLLEQDLGEDLTKDIRTDLGFIREAADRMRALVADLLDLSRAGAEGVELRPIALAECAAEAIDSLAVAIDAAGAQVIVPELPEVCGEPRLLKQLYQNLISNALKFAGDDPPRVELTVARVGGGLVFGVRDNGIGIEPEHLERIFEPFKRLHARAEYDGTGIGLAICRKAVNRHRGRIWVESHPGEGAHFRFTLPASRTR